MVLLACGALFLAGCAGGPVLGGLARKVVKQEEDKLLIGEIFPAGKSWSLSAQEAAKFRAILATAVKVKPPKGKRSEVRATISPNPKLCLVRVDGETYYFLPPGDVMGYTLGPDEWAKFRRVVAGVMRRK